MKNLIYLLVLLFAFSCAPQQRTADREESVLRPEKNDDGEWDIIVMDSQWDYFLNAIARPPQMYSLDYLRNRNSFLVSEWNSLYSSGRYRNIIESSIEYNPYENYGFEFEYKLYQVFAFVHWKYRLRLNGLSAADVRW